ncbi:hypothetical protein ACHAPT_009885 [Fusarium lateritium]
MDSTPKPSSQQGDVNEEKINAVKTLLDETETTPGKATALLNLQGSTSDPESDQDDDNDSSEGEDPWLDDDAQRVPRLPGVPVSPEAYLQGVTAAEVCNGYGGDYQQSYQMRIEADDEPMGRTASVDNQCLGCLFSPFRRLAGKLRKYRKPDPKKGVGRGRNPSDDAITIPPPKQTPVEPNRFELCLKKALFEETVNVSTTVGEPGWRDEADSSPDTSIFPGWNDPAEEFKLQPQGRFVAEAKKSLDEFLEHSQLGVNLSVLGNGGGFSGTGLPALVKKAFTSYQWLGMWRSSEGRKIKVSRWALGGKERPTKSDEKSQELSEKDQEQLVSLENELLGLDKYMGGDSEYLTVVTYSDDYVGAIALFQAKLSPDHKITSLDRVAMISDVPRMICDILQEEISPNRYVVGRAKRKVKCFDRGGLPPPQIIKVSNQATPWSSSGGGWRQALRVPQLTTEYSSGEGLVATIPQMIGLLHLQHLTLTKLASSQAFVFEKPIDASGGPLRRGILLKGRPEGLSHIGQNTRIAVLFPMDSAWAREQFFWA